MLAAACAPRGASEAASSPLTPRTPTPTPLPAPAPAPPPAAVGAVPAFEDARIHEIVAAVSPARMEADVRTLVAFGTRHTLSDTLSATRGIGAARRWIHAEFERISAACGGCLEVRYISEVLPAGHSARIPHEVEVVNVVATLRGATDPKRVVMLTGDIDSRVTDVNDFESDSPGANDNATGVAATLEAARVLSRYPTDGSIVFAALSGEEQGLNGGEILARHAHENGWRIEAVINNDMIGNIRGITGVVENTTARVFAPGLHPETSEAELRRVLSTGGELDTPARQLARYIARVADTYLPNLDVEIIYRLDRYGRGGHHTPFFLAGFPAAVRLMEAHEHYDRQHQDLRVEDGRRYGDLLEGVDFDFAARLTAVNAAVLAALAWAPPAPTNVRIGGAVRPSTTLAWEGAPHPDRLGYRVYWRDTTAPQWEHSRFVGEVTFQALSGRPVFTDLWIERKKVWLGHNFLRRQSAFHVLVPQEFGRGDIAIDGPAPRSNGAVERDHGRYPGRGRPATAVAAVHHPGQRNRAAEAFFTDFAVAVEGGTRTDESVVVQRLNDRCAFPASGVVRGRGDQREGIVKVHHVWPLGSADALQFRCHVGVPQRFTCERHLAELSDLIVV